MCNLTDEEIMSIAHPGDTIGFARAVLAASKDGCCKDILKSFRNDVDLIRAVLEGQPASIARNDALFTAKRLIAEIDKLT